MLTNAGQLFSVVLSSCGTACLDKEAWFARGGDGAATLQPQDRTSPWCTEMNMGVSARFILGQKATLSKK
jgi:hypothetical protein